METCIVRQPILNNKREVVAYEILYQQDDSTLYNQRDFHAANAIEEFFMELDQKNFLGGKDAFLTFTPNLIMKNIPRIFSEKKLVIQIEDNVIVHPVAQKIIYRFKKQGYRIALVGFEFNPRYFGIMDVVDIVKVNLENPNRERVQNIINIANNLNKQVCVYNVNTQEAYELAKEIGAHYMQGDSVATMMKTKTRRMDHLQSNFFQLIIAVTKDEPDLDEIARIISLDVTLAFSLMKMVNSAYFALTNRVKSVKQALTILGLGQLKQWVYLLSFTGDNDGASEELIKVSFLRASLCQELSTLMQDLPISRSEAYLMGMFSTLDVLMEVPLEDALKELPVSGEVKRGLLEKEGLCGDLYELMLCYEKADWSKVNRLAEKLGLPVNVISQKYFDCAENVNAMWNKLTKPFAGEEDGEPEPPAPAAEPQSEAAPDAAAAEPAKGAASGGKTARQLRRESQKGEK